MDKITLKQIFDGILEANHKLAVENEKLKILYDTYELSIKNLTNRIKAKNEINKVLIKENKKLLQIIHNVKNYVKHHQIDYISRNNILSILEGKEVKDEKINT